MNVKTNVCVMRISILQFIRLSKVQQTDCLCILGDAKCLSDVTSDTGNLVQRREKGLVVHSAFSMFRTAPCEWDESSE
jgi:hypothetical protein